METQGVNLQINRNHIIDLDADADGGGLNDNLFRREGQIQVLGFGQDVVADLFSGGTLGQPEWRLSLNIVLKLIVVDVNRNDLETAINHRRNKGQCEKCLEPSFARIWS